MAASPHSHDPVQISTSHASHSAPGLATRLAAFYYRHQGFFYLLPLFISLRLLALVLLRPGGFIADNSDFDFYATWGALIPMGYDAYDNLWTAYPPLFPLVMLTAHEWASRIPPWTDPRLFFHLIFGAILVLFDTGNLGLIYRLGNKLQRDEAQLEAPPIPPVPGTVVRRTVWGARGLHAAFFYALCFVPLYTLLGWFEPMPLFFLLLGLDLLLTARAWGWWGSAVAAGLGFLTKLTPILLLPVAVGWLGARLNWRAARTEWFNPQARGNLLRPTVYVLIFLVVVAGIGYPLVQENLSLAFSSFRIQSIRPPWQSVWALIDGYYGYGEVPLDMRNLSGLAGPLWETRIPWTWVGVAFVLLYLWLYTRPYDWRRVRTPIAWTAVSVLLLFLYSKGWSPQFLIWVLVFIALLLPTLRGILIAVLLSLVNVVESYVYIIMLPEEHWILVGTVVVRTLLLVLLLVELLGQIWPRAGVQVRLQRLAAQASWVVMIAAVVAAGVAVPRAARAYWDQQLAAHPCREAITQLDEAAGGVNQTLVTQQIPVWRDLYPWLRQEYTLRVLDGYRPDYNFADELLARANALAPTEFWWVSRPDLPYTGDRPAEAHDRFVAQPSVHVVAEQMAGACRLERIVQLDGTSAATVDVAGGPIVLEAVATGPAQMGAPFEVVLYWQALSPVTARYTVFTQLFGPDGSMVAQQDNWPVQGLAPTDTWQPETLIRDVYTLDLPADIPAGTYRLLVGMYDEAGRRTLTPQGEHAGQGARDALEISVTVAPQ